jgi:uncharacterized protein YkwD
MNLATVIITGLLAPCVAIAADDSKNLDNYLVDMGSGPVSAADILGVSASAVTTIQTAKDFVAALNAGNSDGAKSGRALSITPGRTVLAPVAISDYADSSKVFARIWGNTTFSYAQNSVDISGANYKQDALALHISYFLNTANDPTVAGYRAFALCQPMQQEIQQDLKDDQAAIDEALKKLNAERATQGVPPLQVLPKNMKDALMKDREQVSSTSYTKAANMAKKCYADGAAQARKRWNAAQIALVAGQGWIKGGDSGARKVSLGRNVALTGAFGPNDNSLVNVTLRRASSEVDLTTLQDAAPTFKSSTLVAARYTVGYGEARDFYGLAEISNVKASKATIANSAFKYALGVDKRLMEGVWLELRVGRNRTMDGGKEQTTALFNLKFSPTTSLPKIAATP